jgi:DNA-binding NarL/FixJ family response regulator
MSATPIRILIIDDHAVLRAGLANLLSFEDAIFVVGEADGGAEGVRLWKKLKPDVAIVDVSMAGLDGIETVRQIRGLDPGARTVMLTSSESAADAARAMAAGAAAYLTKHCPHDEIVAVIRAVHAGATAIRRGVRLPGPSPAELLTPRELEVLHYLRLGTGNAEIARKLGVVERTVKAHVTAILAKLHAHDRAGAVARGFDLGLLQVASDAAAAAR